MNSQSSNSLWKVDLIEYKIFGYVPRFRNTPKLLKAKNNQKLLKKLPSNKEDAQTEVNSIKSVVFNNKYHGVVKKMKTEIKKIVKSDLHRLSAQKDKKELLDFLNNEEYIQHLITSKVVKSIQGSILTTKALKASPPTYIPEELLSIMKDKENVCNPSNFFKTHCQHNKIVNNYISNLWNNKNLKSTLNQAEWSFKLVRGNLTKEEINARRKSLGKTVSEDNNGHSDLDESDDDEARDDEVDQEDIEKYAVYDNLIADSDEEEQTLQLNPEVNYSEVTDEEPSESDNDKDIESDSENEDLPVEKPLEKAKKQKKDDFFEEGSSEDDNVDDDDDDDIESKYNLPELATGYISGGSDDESFNVDNDKIVRQATSQRKNRRGQRARQKIWEKKFGKQAKHKQKEIAAVENDRKRRQLEFEERERKRQERAKEAMENAPSGSNLTPIGNKKEANTVPKEVHPSWIAKKQAEEKLKNVKFTGKKITFD